MDIILQTMITNKLEQGRTVRWAGKRGLFLPGNESVIVDEAYPTACRNPSSVKQLENEIEQGLVELTIITNLNTAKPVAKKGGVKNPAAVKAAAKAEEDAQKAEPLTEFKNTKEERFVQKDSPDNTLEPEAKPLPVPGREELAIPEPVTKEMFPDGNTLSQEGMKTVEQSKEEAAEVKVEDPAKAVETKEEAPKKEAPKKPSRRKKKTDDASDDKK